MQSITRLEMAETFTKKTLSDLSRELLDFTVNTGDIRPINALLSGTVLTAMNFKIAAKYFSHFLPFSSNIQSANDYISKSNGARVPVQFGSKNKKTFAKKVEVIDAWLSVVDNNIWSWADDNVQLEKKAIDWNKRISNAITGGLENGLSKRDVLELLSQLEFTANDLMDALDLDTSVSTKVMIEGEPAIEPSF